MEIKLDQKRSSLGAFYIDDDGTRLGEMDFLINDGVMNIYHTEVNPSIGSHNWGFKLVETGVKFARENRLKILPTCTFAKSVFNRTEAFQDVLVKEE